jgi:hypothetical protein
MFRRFGIGLALALLLAATISSMASAHVPNAYLVCNADHQPQLVINLTQYNATKKNGLSQNTVEASADGTETLPETLFGSSYSHTFTLVGPYVAHTAVVNVFAWDGPNNPNWTKTFVLNGALCLEPTPSPTLAPTPTPVVTPTPTPTPVVTPGPTVTPSPTASVPPTASEPIFTPPATGTTSTPDSGSSSLPLVLFVLAWVSMFGALVHKRVTAR